MERFVAFIKRLTEKGLLGVVGVINVDPQTKKATLLKCQKKEME